jgi:hypothetical protein
VQLKRAALDELLKQAPPEFSVPASVYSLEIDVPMPYGNFSRFRIEESPIMEPGLAKKYPEIKTYIGHTADGLVFTDGTTTSPAASTTRPAFRDLVQQDRVQSLLDKLRGTEYEAAAHELLAHGPTAIPPLVEALAEQPRPREVADGPAPSGKRQKAIAWPRGKTAY